MKPLQLILAAIVAVLPILSPAEEQKNPNVLLICVDDLRPELGCYGSDHVISPNIDRLSASGVTFDNCYVQVAVCNPSRASMMTGLRPDTLGCWTLRYHFRETMPDAVTLPQYLRTQGYEAEGYGKIFHNPWQDPQSWSRPHRFGPGDWFHYTDEQKRFTKEVQASLPDDNVHKRDLRGPISNDPDIEDAEHPDAAMADIVINRLADLKGSGQPFFLAAGFVLPHLPWCPPKKYWDLYDRASLPMAKNPFVPTGAPDVSVGTSYEFRHYADTTDLPSPHEGSVSEENARRYHHAYLASVTFVDSQIGRFLDALDELHLGDDTIVVLWSDHGYKLGEHNGWGKMTNFEIDTRIPFIIRAPGAKANGKRCGRLVETLDLFPTLCELANVPVPGFLEGKSAAPLLDDPAGEHIDAAFSQYIYSPLIGNAICTDHWRYVEWRTMENGEVQHRELYDHRSDDEENENVLQQHPDVVSTLSSRLQSVLPPHKVELRPQIHSEAGGEKLQVEFANQHPGAVRLTWISPRGERAQVYDIKEGETRPIKSFIGHVFVAESIDGRYHEILKLKKEHTRIELGAASGQQAGIAPIHPPNRQSGSKYPPVEPEALVM